MILLLCRKSFFYRNAEYIVQIPKDFYKTCIVQDNPISVTKIPGSYTSFYVDQQINAWLNNVRTYIASGFSQKEAAKAALEQPSSRVSMYQGHRNHFRNTGIYLLFPLCSLSVSGCSVLFHGLYSSCFSERRYPETYAGFIRFHSPAEP